MYKDLKDKGFEILDFPSNQFANQAPGSDEEIHQFCTMKFGTEFPQFAKIDVNGETAFARIPNPCEESFDFSAIMLMGVETPMSFLLGE